MKLKIKKAFDRERCQLQFQDEQGNYLKEVRVEQHHSDDTLVQNILRKYDSTGVFYHVNKARASYQDNTPFNEYADMYNKIKAADANFMELPSEIRAKFNNDTGAFLEFVNDDANIDEMYDIGLIQRPADPDAIKVTEPAPVKEAKTETENQE